jgi:hypothetical protein
MPTWIQRNEERIELWSKVVSTVVQVIALAIAGFWTYHLHLVTSESEQNPNLTMSISVLPYTEGDRLLTIHVKPKNVGKVPIVIRQGDESRGGMWVRIKRLPASAKNGPVDTDALPVLFEKPGMLKRYLHNGETYELDPGVEFDELATFVVPVGKYHIESEIDYPSVDVGDQEIISVQ